MSNPYPDRFADLLTRVADDGCVLDCGSGPRVHPDKRVVSFDQFPHDGVTPGDIADLPYVDDTFDLILSQAVLEHVRDPERCMAEMVRVLKPGGHLYIELPFIQPFHAAPDHFRNYTLPGLRLLCRDLIEVDSSAWGGLSLSVEWIGRGAGAPQSLGSSRWKRLLTDLRTVDASMTQQQIETVAYAVCGTFRKP